MTNENMAREMLGWTYEDKVTGFTGVCTGYVEYISGCHQAMLAPKVGKDGKASDASWFDVQRLQRTEAQRVYIDNQWTPGHDAPAPVR